MSRQGIKWNFNATLDLSRGTQTELPWQEHGIQAINISRSLASNAFCMSNQYFPRILMSKVWSCINFSQAKQVNFWTRSSTWMMGCQNPHNFQCSYHKYLPCAACIQEELSENHFTRYSCHFMHVITPRCILSITRNMCVCIYIYNHACLNNCVKNHFMRYLCHYACYHTKVYNEHH